MQLKYCKLNFYFEAFIHIIYACFIEWFLLHFTVAVLVISNSRYNDYQTEPHHCV